MPPCHGLVYLAGASLAVWAAPRRTALVRVALVAVLAWGIAGVTVLPRTDVGGAIGAGILAVYLVRGRAPEVYAGVFLVVAWLELYGTAIGTWEWAASIPGPASHTATRRAASRPATSGSTSSLSRLPRGCSDWQSELEVGAAWRRRRRAWSSAG